MQTNIEAPSFEIWLLVCDKIFKFSTIINIYAKVKEKVFCFCHRIMEASLVMWPRPFEQLLDSLLPRCCIWNLIENGPADSEEESFENVDLHSILVTFDQGPSMTLTFDIHRGSCCTYFNITEYHCFGKYNVSPFLHSKHQGIKFDLDEKMVQGQTGVTIWTNLVVSS